jgi:hypothetical protein
MKPDLSIVPVHPQGEPVLTENRDSVPAVIAEQRMPVDTLGGRVHVEWDPHSPVTPMGQLVFFTQFLNVSNLFDPWVNECPLAYTSPNAPAVRDVLGTSLLSILSGHNRYTHVTALRNDTVNPPLLGMKKVVSEDSLRRAFEDQPAQPIETWQRKHLLLSYEPLLQEEWILDIDTTIKTVYGHQQGAQVGYNPHKKGRPSHVYHTFFMGAARLVLDVEVQPGKQTAAHHSLPNLWRWIDERPKGSRPWLVRGDCAFGQDHLMCQAESRNQDYLFKLRMTQKPKDLIKQMEKEGGWVDAGKGWEGREGALALQGWNRRRRVIILRRKIEKTINVAAPVAGFQLFLNWGGLFPVQGQQYEYAVLVTSLILEVLTVAQLYRDRGDMENNFDELKNQWGWGGFTTEDILRCQIAARTVALIYNWWSLFVRLADPSKRREAITSRPMLLGGVARQTTHGGQVSIVITPMHGHAAKIQEMLNAVTAFLRGLIENAEQLTTVQRWRRILSKVFEKQLGGRPLREPGLALEAG